MNVSIDSVLTTVTKVKNAFIIIVKVAHFVFTTHHSKDHNFYT